MSKTKEVCAQTQQCHKHFMCFHFLLVPPRAFECTRACYSFTLGSNFCWWSTSVSVQGGAVKVPTIWAYQTKVSVSLIPAFFLSVMNPNIHRSHHSFGMIRSGKYRVYCTFIDIVVQLLVNLVDIKAATSWIHHDNICMQNLVEESLGEATKLHSPPPPW